MASPTTDPGSTGSKPDFALDDDALPGLEAEVAKGEDLPLTKVPGEQAPAAEDAPSPQEELERWRDLAMRSQADLENFRKRMAREKSDAIRYANAALLEELLPVLDNFHLGLEAARGSEDASSTTIFQGMAMVHKQIQDFLLAQGVVEIASAGAPFDPNLHEAVAHEHSDTVPEGQIISEIRKGYQLADRLLRASAVVVSKGPRDDS
ncbi:MAG: nucleotide exchange factor GrpE [Verrucomicrobiales bacterium]